MDENIALLLAEAKKLIRMKKEQIERNSKKENDRNSMKRYLPDVDSKQDPEVTSSCPDDETGNSSSNLAKLPAGLTARKRKFVKEMTIKSKKSTFDSDEVDEIVID
jgi:hypothetical protein